jgi:hypothetical protein
LPTGNSKQQNTKEVAWQLEKSADFSQNLKVAEDAED